MTLRAIRVLREVAWIAAEDTRRARILLQAHGVSARPLAHHAHNEHREVSRLLVRLRNGESGALITDAGTPGICDPGFLLARAARRESIPVVVLPGPSAVITAVLASGFPPEPFVFLGYAPTGAGRRVRFLESVRDDPRTVVFFETPHRIRALFEEAARVLGAREIALARELTKVHEEVLHGSAASLLAMLPEKPRGEIVIIVAPLLRRTKGAAELETTQLDAAGFDEAGDPQSVVDSLVASDHSDPEADDFEDEEQ